MNKAGMRAKMDQGSAGLREAFRQHPDIAQELIDKIALAASDYSGYYRLLSEMREMPLELGQALVAIMGLKVLECYLDSSDEPQESEDNLLNIDQAVLCRLREIANRACNGLPPHSLDDVRFLLDVIKATGSVEIAEAAQYQIPVSRCRLCGGDGCMECLQ